MKEATIRALAFALLPKLADRGVPVIAFRIRTFSL